LAGEAARLFSVAFSRIEVAAVFHRHVRAGRTSQAESKETLLQFAPDCTNGVVTFLPISSALVEAAPPACNAEVTAI
jgi:hypothetical protein